MKFPLQNEFLKNVLTLFTGTALASVVPLFFSVFISRLYTPEQFGTFAIITSIIGVVVNIAGGRYEMAIMQPKNNQKSKNLVGLSMLVSLVFCLFLLVFFVVFGSQLVDILHINEVEKWLLVLPAIVWLMSLFKPLNFWLTRQKKYQYSSISKIVQSIGITLATVILGYLGVESGLILGYVIGWAGFVSLLWYYHQKSFGSEFKVQLSELIPLAREYKSFPKLNAPSSLLNDTAVHLSVFFISYYYTVEETGFFNFSRQYIYVPMSVIAVSISNVYFQRISEKIANQDSLLSEFRKLSLVLLALLVVGVSFVYFFATPTFSLIFGEEWGYAGELASILIFSYAIRFLVSPLSNVLPALNELKLASIFPVIYILSISSLYFFKGENFETFLSYMVLLEVFAYLIYLAIIYWAIMKYEKLLIVENQNKY